MALAPKYIPPVGGAANDSYITGDPANGIEGSAVPGEALEWPQREIINALLGHGITLDGDDNTQLNVLLQTFAKLNVKQTFTKQQTPLSGGLTFNATQTWDCDLAQVAKLALTNNVTIFSAPTNQVADTFYLLRVDVGSPVKTITAWNAAFNFPGGVAPTFSTTVNAIDVLVFLSDGTNMELIGLAQDVK